MKTLAKIVLFVGLFTQSATAATALIKRTIGQALEPSPTEITLSVLDDGNVQLKTLYIHTDESTTETLAIINAERIAALKAFVEQILMRKKS